MIDDIARPSSRKPKSPAPKPSVPMNDNNPIHHFPRKPILVSLVIVVVLVIGAVLLYHHDHKSVAITTLPASSQSNSSTTTVSTVPIEPLAANKLVQSFYAAFIASNNPTNVIKQYGTATLLAAYTNYYIHNSSSVSAQNYADGSIVCGSVKPQSIASVGTLTSGASSAQVQVVEVESKGSSKTNPTATLSAAVVHQGSSLKINSVQCQELVGSDSHSPN